MSELSDRVECTELLSRLVPAEEAVKHVTDHCRIAISGFTKSGEPKTFIPALAKYFSEQLPNARIALFSGASLSDEVENCLKIIHKLTD